MNDRFRFRIWNEKEKSFIVNHKYPIGSDYFLVLTAEGELVKMGIGDFNGYGQYSWGSVENYEGIIEQCTGIKDKNGRLIYEGDLFELEEGAIDTVREVVWDKDTSSFKVSCRGKEEYNNGLYNEMREYEELLDLSLFLDCACIIGNIHENADLLEDKK